MKSMKKTIVIFSNPFGYGPTGTVVPVLENLVARLKGSNIVFAGSGLCMEIISGMHTEAVLLDERDEQEIEIYLRKIPNAYVISSQNRFCIKVAKKLGLPCAFIDVLAWFWKEIPPEHFLADEIFWMKFPNIESKLKQKPVHLVSGIITTLPPVKKEKKVIIHIGGAKYPLMKHLPYHYLNLISKALNGFRKGEDFAKVFFVAGSDAMNYIKPKVSNQDVTITILPREIFMRECARASHVFTTAGVSSTLESFSMDTPTSFLLPLNLSQIALTDLLKEQGAYLQGLEWDHYVDVKKDLRQLNEKEALVEIDSYAKLVDEDEQLSGKFVRDFSRMVKSIPDNTKQQKFIKYMGHSGGKEIADILIKKWNLV